MAIIIDLRCGSGMYDDDKTTMVMMRRSKKIITRSMRLNFLSGENAAVNHQLSTTSRVVAEG